MGMISHLLTDTVTYAGVSGRNNSGDPIFGSQSTAPARVEFGAFRTFDANGTEIDAQAKIATETNIPHRARVWLPGDNTASSAEGRPIKRRVEASTPGGSLTLYELYL